MNFFYLNKMLMMSKVFVLTTMVTFVSSRSLAADDVSADEIAEKIKAKNTFGFDNARARLELLLISKRGHQRQRVLDIKSQKVGGEGRSLIRFLQPGDVAGTGFLVIENKNADDDQYLYLPALGKVKRITGRQRNQKFMGTDLSYADLESRNLDDAELKRLPDEALGGNDSYVLESIPKNLKDSQYSKTISWVHKKSFVPLKIEFYDKKGRLQKVLKVKELKKQDGRWLATKTHIDDKIAGTQTKMNMQQVDFSVTLKPGDFTEAALKDG